VRTTHSRVRWYYYQSQGEVVHLGQPTPVLFTFPRLYLLPKIPSPKSLCFTLHLPLFAPVAVTEQMARGGQEHHVKGQYRDSHGRFRQTDSSSTVGKVKLGPPPLLNDRQGQARPTLLLNGQQGQARSTPFSMADKIKLGPIPSSGGRIFRASSS
jgi:hypothetical protein